MHKKLIKKLSPGFTLMETIVAIAIILSGVVGVLILLAQSAKSVRVAEDRMIASHLAQEAIEVVVAIRDSNWAAGDPWDNNIPLTAQGIVNYDSAVVSTTGNPADFCLSILNNIYTHGTPPCNTIFSRHLEINSFVDPDLGVPYLEVKAVVDWVDGNTTRTIEVVDELFNWQ